MQKIRIPPTDPSELSQFDGIVMRSLRTGRVRQWAMRNTAADEMMALLPETIVVNDPAAMREAARLGLGVAMLTLPDVLPDLENGTLVRLLPHWYSDAGRYRSTTLRAHFCPPRRGPSSIWLWRRSSEIGLLEALDNDRLSAFPKETASIALKGDMDYISQSIYIIQDMK